MEWARILAYITGTVDQELLLRNEYLAAENRILRGQLKGRLRFSDAERAKLGEIGRRLGRKAEQLFGFLVLGHGRRRLIWSAVTAHPTAEWLARQITEAFPWDEAPKYLIRDNDRAFGAVFKAHVRAMGIRDIIPVPLAKRIC